jgi:hypothetical protein
MRRHAACRFCLVSLFALHAAGCSGGNAASDGAPETATAQAGGGPADACRLLTPAEVASIVGNAVEPGAAFAGPEVCKWDAPAGNTTVLLTVRPKNSTRETYLCQELRKSAEARRIDGLGDAAVWTFSNTMGLFNSGELETCGDKGYVAVSVDGKADQPTLRAAAEAIVRKVLGTL